MSMPLNPDVSASPRRVARTTAIEWTEATWNPTTGCDRVSPGCDHCYAMTLAKRLKGMGSPKYQTDGDPRTSGPGFGVAAHTDVLTLPLRWRQPRRIFVNSMSDLFHDRVPDEFVAEVFAVMALAPQHTFQLLTKRHGRMRSFLTKPPKNDEGEYETDAGWLPGSGAYHMVADALEAMKGRDGLRLTDEQWALVEHPLGHLEWPLPNVWLGVSAENQKWADIRIPALLETPAAVRWVSAEPLLGPLDLNLYMSGSEEHAPWNYTEFGVECMCKAPMKDERCTAPGLDWVVVGGESGPNCRVPDVDWFRSLRDECVGAGVPFLFKQHGGRTPKANGRELDGRTWDEYPAAA